MTNRVLVQASSKKNIYYCPAYMRLKIKNFAQMSMVDLQASVNTTIIMTVNFKEVPSFLVDEIKQRMILRFNRNEAIVLKDSNTEVTIKN